MSIEHYQSDPKESPTAQSLVQGEINALVSFWPDIRDDDSIGPSVAFNMLATWAHVRRFNPDTLDDSLVTRLNELVTDELSVICDQALNFPFPPDWHEVANRLDEDWDYLFDNDEIDELEHTISEYFELLDRGSLVAYAIARLKSPLFEDERYLSFRESLHRAEDFLAENPDVFLPAAVYASSMLDSYCHELHEFDEEIWETTLKHRSLQELIDEQENPRRLPKIDPNVIRQLFEEKHEATPSNESVNQEAFKEMSPSYFERSSLESVQVDSVGQKAPSDQQKTTKHLNLPVVEAERIGQTKNWFSDEVELPEDAKAYFLNLFVTIDIQEVNNQLEFFILSVPNPKKVGQPETVCEWVVSANSRNEKVKDVKPNVGPFQLNDLAKTPRKISLKLGDKVIPVFDLKVKKG